MEWKGQWARLEGKHPTLAPSLVVDADDRLGLLANLSGSLCARWMNDRDEWDDWADTGGTSIAGRPVPARAADGRIGVFYRDPDNRLMCQAQLADRSGWGAPRQVADALLTGDPVVEPNADGQIEVFFTGTDGALWHVWAVGAGLEDWSRDVFGGGAVRDIAVTSTADHRQAFFHANTSGDLWLTQKTSPGGGWSSFTNPVGNVTGPVAVGAPAGGILLAVFASHQSQSDDVLSYARQDDTGAWSGPHELMFDETARPNTDPAVAPVLVPGPQGRLIAVHAFATSLWIIREPAIGDPVGAWETIAHLEDYFVTGLSAVSDAGGRLAVLANSAKFGCWFLRYTPSL